MAAILDCPEIFAGRMAAILDLRVHDSNESPTNAPHSCGQEPQNARIPHLLGTQRAAIKVINPHQSPTYPGVGGGGGRGLLWLVHKPAFLSSAFTKTNNTRTKKEN